MTNLREASKQNWNADRSITDINAGSLQRIADATEKMAGNYISLQNDLERYKKWHSERSAEVISLGRVNKALRGVITKFKKKSKRASELEQENTSLKMSVDFLRGLRLSYEKKLGIDSSEWLAAVENEK